MKYIIGLLIRAGLWACTKEDWPDNSRPEVNPFAVPADATGEEAELRRGFFDRTGMYLLFSDTLVAQEVNAVSAKKEKVYIKVHLEWNMVSTNQGIDSFICYPYKTLAEKKMLTEFVEREVLTSVPVLFYPYSIMLLDRLVYFQYNYYGGYEDPVEYSFYAGMQSTVITVSNLSAFTAGEKEKLKTNLVGNLISSNISVIPEADWADFYTYSDEYYKLSSQYVVPYPIEACGYLPTYADAGWGGPDFHTKEYDVKAYVEEIFKLSESEFRETYAEYPIIIDKMEEMVKVLRKHGVKVYE